MPRRRPSDLDRLHQCLKGKAGRPHSPSYRVPALWNCWGFERAAPIPHRSREIAVNPYEFALDCLERVILPARGDRRLAGRSLSQSLVMGNLPGQSHVRNQSRDREGAVPPQLARTHPLRSGLCLVAPIAGDTREHAIALGGLSGKQVLDRESKRRPGDWLRSAAIYGMLVRTTTAWDHNGDGRLTASRWTETGTFLKSILLLPLLVHLGINALYLLPITKISHAFRKGEVGCPYSAMNFFEIEPELHDRLLDDGPLDVAGQFAAFIEAAHAVGIRVMVDLCPRTAARDSDLILDHPDWFYWIDAKSADGYGPPHLEGVKPGIPKPSQLADILGRDIMRRHLAKFRHDPSVTAPRQWRRFVKRCRAKPPVDLLAAIADEFGVITPPGFSDCINDPQPPWSDVTFLRLYLDHPTASVRHLDDPARQPLTRRPERSSGIAARSVPLSGTRRVKGQPPYVFTDTIKASKFPGRRPNRRLWNLLSNILPFYQRFGVDGARVDMGHALPPGLQRMLLAKPRRIDPDFAFLAEELSHEGDKAARRDGYNALIGSSWYMEPRHATGELAHWVNEVLPSAVLPALAAAETPDTPRAAARRGGRSFARLIAVLNNFLPSAIPFVNSGQELLERQPMNLGLDMQPSAQFALPPDDPYYGKLAYFDRVALHWGSAEAAQIIDLLGQAAAIRKKYLGDLTDVRNYFAPKVANPDEAIIIVGWRVSRGREILLVTANVDFRWKRARRISVPPAELGLRNRYEELLRIRRRSPSSRSPALRMKRGRLQIDVLPGDVSIVLLSSE